jgi:hypothetical protein
MSLSLNIKLLHEIIVNHYTIIGTIKITIVIIIGLKLYYSNIKSVIGEKNHFICLVIAKNKMFL